MSGRHEVTAEQLAEWERLAEAATKGPWEAESGQLGDKNPPMRHMVYEPDGPRVADCNGWFVEGEQPRANAEFIAAAREAVPALIAEVLALRATLRGERARGRAEGTQVTDEMVERAARFLGAQAIWDTDMIDQHMRYRYKSLARMTLEAALEAPTHA